MEFVEIKKYMLQWDLKKHKGSISVYWKDEGDPEDKLSGTRLEVADKDEYAILVDILRNEKPIFMRKEDLVLTTQKEAVGENEK